MQRRSFVNLNAAPRSSLVLAAAGALAFFAPTAHAQTFTGLGLLPGVPNSYARAVSADGTTAVGWTDSDGSGLTNAHAIRWTRAAGLQDLGFLGTFHGAAAGAVNGDGSVVVGWSSTSNSSVPRPFRWTSAAGMQNLGDLGGSPLVESKARGVSRDGSVVVGWSVTPAGPQHAFRWTSAGGMQDLGPGPAPINGESSYAYAVSGDGATVFGLAAFDVSVGDRAARWTAATSWQPLGTGNGATPGFFDYVYGTNISGSIAVGISSDRSTQHNHAYAWTPTGIRDLGMLPTDTDAQAFAVSDDGTRIVGYSGNYSVTPIALDAILWTPSGAVSLNAYLPTLGIDLTAWTLYAALGISADGLVIVGEGSHNGHAEGWVADLHPAPPRCGSADFNCDGDTGTDQDIEAFFACLAGNCPTPPCTSSADFNGDGDSGTDADIESFFRVLAGGSC